MSLFLRRISFQGDCIEGNNGHFPGVKIITLRGGNDYLGSRSSAGGLQSSGFSPQPHTPCRSEQIGLQAFGGGENGLCGAGLSAMIDAMMHAPYRSSGKSCTLGACYR